MSRYVPKKTRTRSTTRRRSRSIPTLVVGCATLTLVSLLSLSGPKPDSVPSVYPTSLSTVVPQESINEDWQQSTDEATLVAQTIYGEARGCRREEQMLVAWCICNRADAYNQSVEEVVTAPYQFTGYNPKNPVEPEHLEVATEVLKAWARGEKALVLPPYATTSEYLFFGGDGEHNWFREEF